MEREVKVSVRHLTKKFQLKSKRHNNENASIATKDFWALRGLSFDVYAGEAIGLIGTNGSGKSTLANIISGTSMPTTGELQINGKTSIIAIGSGLKKELTGRENVMLKCLLSGMTKSEVESIIDDIIAFADIDDFIDQPLKNYSSGMKSRLGFSISVHNNPDILIIDEALSVGDDTFYQRCVDKIYDFKEQGKTIFFVSHSTRQIKNLCDRALWIHEGELKEFGPVEDVLTSYKEYVSWYKSLARNEQKKHKKQLKKARKTFTIKEGFEKALAEEPENHELLEQIFYPKQKNEKMTMMTKISILMLIIALGVLGGYYMSQLWR